MLEYNDAYLSKFCNEDREARAAAEIALLDPDGDFSQDWTDKLTVLKAYILACQENIADDDDLFSTKLEIYDKEFDKSLVQALASISPDDEGNYAGIFTIPIERA